LPLEFKKINYLSIAKRLREILTEENIEFEEETIKELARKSAGDFRSALLDTQSLSMEGIFKISDLPLITRDRQEKIFKVMSILFHSKSLSEMRRARAALWFSQILF